MRLHVGSLALLMPLVIMGACGGPDRESTVKPTASVSAERTYATADELMTEAVDAGMTCNKPGMGSQFSPAIDQIGCEPRYGGGSTYRIYANGVDRQHDIDLFTKSAQFDVAEGRVPTCLLIGNYWLASGDLKTLKAVADRLGGDVLDLTTVEPRYDGNEVG